MLSNTYIHTWKKGLVYYEKESSNKFYKWSFFIEPGLDGSGKNQKSWFIPNGLKVNLGPWGHVLSLKSFSGNPVLSWAIRYSVDIKKAIVVLVLKTLKKKSTM